MALSRYGSTLLPSMNVGGRNLPAAASVKTGFTQAPAQGVMQGKITPRHAPSPLLSKATMHIQPGPPPISPVVAPPKVAPQKLMQPGAVMSMPTRQQAAPTPLAPVLGVQGGGVMSVPRQGGYVPTSPMSTAKSMPAGVAAQFQHPIAQAPSTPQAAPILSLFQAAGFSPKTGVSAAPAFLPPTTSLKSAATTGKNAPGQDQLNSTQKARVNFSPGAPSTSSMPGESAGAAAEALDAKAQEALEAANALAGSDDWKKWAMYGGAALLAWFVIDETLSRAQVSKLSVEGED